MMEEMGSIIHVEKLTDIQYNKQLRFKLLEEAEEVRFAKSQQELLEELADVLEVIDSLCALHNLTHKEIKKVQEKKRNKRGGFVGRKFVSIAEHPDNSFGSNYCLSSPKKYPEIVD